MSSDQQQQSRLASAVLATLAAAGMTASAHAGDRHWVNTQPTAGWNTPSNWSPAGVPGQGDNVTIINRGSQFQTITYDIPDWTTPPQLAALVLNAEGVGDLRFVMPQNNGATLRTHTTSLGSTDVVTFRHERGRHEVSTLFRLGWGGTNGKATYELVGNGTTLHTSGDAYIGGTGRAEFIQQGDVTHAVNGGLYLGSPDTNTQNVYQMNGGNLTTGQLWVGDWGNGSFSHGAGLVNAGDRLVIAGAANSIGYYDMWTGAALTSAAGQVGVRGQGTMNHRGGRAWLANLTLGVEPAGWGTYTLGGGTLDGMNHVIGQQGRAMLMNDRGLHTVGSMTVARDAGSNASYFIGHGATLTVNQDVTVAGAGSGQFNQNGGATTIGRGLIVGEATGSAGNVGLAFGTLSAQFAQLGHRGTGTLTVDGAAATFSNAVALGTGTNGVGRLNVASGSLTTGVLSLGEGQDGAGTAHQTGGSVRANNVIYVGNVAVASGTYTLAGGTLSAPNVYVGANGRGVFTQTGGSHTVTERLGIRAFPTAAGTYNMQGGSLNVGTFENHGAFHQTGGTTRTTWTVGGGQLGIMGGTFTTDRLNYSGQTFVTGTGTLRIDDGAGSNTFGSTMPFLEVRDTGRVDITDKALVVDYAPAAVNPMPALAQHVRGAYNGGAWDAPGIGSSQVPAGYGVGFAPGSVGTAFDGPFAGMNFDDTSVLIAVVRFGDGNLDGVVNLADFNALAANFGQSGRGWWEGDFDYNGIVNLNDFNRLAANFGLSASGSTVTPEDWAALGAAVPEPSAALAALAPLTMLRRRRR